MAGSYSIPDLDLDKLDHTDDPKVLVGALSNLINQDSNSKIWAARQWMENFYQFAGLRDVSSRGGQGSVTNNSMTPFYPNSSQRNSQLRRRVPKTFKAVQIQAANITKQSPTIKCWPVDESEAATKAAKLSNITLDYLWEKDNEDALSHESVLYALMTPLVARKNYLDYSFNKSRIFPKFAKDPATGMLLRNAPVLDAKGQPILEQHPWNKAEIIPAFRLIVGSSEGRTSDLDFAVDITYKRLSWLHDNYMKDAPGYFPHECQKVQKGDWNFTALMAMELAIKQVGFGGLRYYKNGYGYGDMKDQVVIVSAYLRPSKNFPEGRKIVLANGTCVFDGSSDAYIERYDMWHPYSFLTYEQVPGRPWGTTYAEKITAIATAYEQCRTEFDRLRRTFSVAKMAMPIGAELDVDTITGDEQVLRYNAFGPDGGKPAYLNAPQPPSTIIDDIKITAGDFTEGSGVTEIMQGIRPQGVTTYRGLEVLKEEANNAQAPFIKANERFLCTSQIIKLENVRKAMVYPSKEFSSALRIFKKQNNYITDVEINDFTGPDLLAIVKIEPDSTIAKSKLAQQEKLMTMAQEGVLGDIVGDPDLNREFKIKMGISGFESTKNQHVIMAKHENEQMLQSGKVGQPVVPPVYPWHDDPIHIRECEIILNDPTMQDKPLVIQSVIQHRMLHEQQAAQKMAAQMEAQAAMSQMTMPQPGKALTQERKKGNNNQKQIFDQGSGGNGGQQGSM